jgi:tripartite-type tricarboxylate transporter receptor subunit TctC
MKIPRRQFLHLVTGAAAVPAVSRVAKAQTYPSRPVRWIVPFASGGSVERFSRVMGQRLSERLGQPFVFEFVTQNEPRWRDMSVATVARAPADGYTLLTIDVTNAVRATVYDKLNFNFIRDIAPAAGIVRTPLVMVVSSSFPAETVPEFIAYAKANPGKIKMASGGIGTLTHISGEMFKMMAGVDMFHVAYRGEAPALADIIGGQVQVIFGVLPVHVDRIRAGEVRALAVTAATRAEALPNVPTVGEFVPGFEAGQWYGVGAPKNTPTEIIHKLNNEINADLADPKIKALIADRGYTEFPISPPNLAMLIANETEKWAKVIRTANIKVE